LFISSSTNRPHGDRQDLDPTFIQDCPTRISVSFSRQIATRWASIVREVWLMIINGLAMCRFHHDSNTNPFLPVINC
jgi:hypothetical protein